MTINEQTTLSIGLIVTIGGGLLYLAWRIAGILKDISYKFEAIDASLIKFSGFQKKMVDALKTLWTIGDFERWLRQLKARNPDIIVPSIDDVRDTPDWERMD